MCRVVVCVAGRGCFAMTSGFSWQNSLSLCPISFCTLRPNLLVLVSLDFLLLHSSPYDKKDIFFFGVSSRRSCRSSHNRSTSASLALLVGA